MSSRFGVLQVTKFKFKSMENIGYEYRNGTVSQKVQTVGEKSLLMKCSILYGGLRGSI